MSVHVSCVSSYAHGFNEQPMSRLFLLMVASLYHNCGQVVVVHRHRQTLLLLLLTKQGLYIFGGLVHVKQLASTQGVRQGVVQLAQVVEDLVGVVCVLVSGKKKHGQILLMPSLCLCLAHSSCKCTA